MALYKATANGQVEMTPEEEAEFEISRNLPPTKEQINYAIIKQLSEIDLKSIRALREGNAGRIATLESMAEALRKQLVK